MRAQHFVIPSIDWSVTVFYDATCFDVDIIDRWLVDIGCKGENLETARENLCSCSFDKGLTFSNNKRSIIVIGASVSKKQYQNTIDHEKQHLLMHISQDLGINPYSEDICYIAGEVGQKMWQYTQLYCCQN